MCDKADDQTLYNWAVNEDDAHSPLASRMWRDIFFYRAGFEDKRWNDAKEYLNKRSITIDELTRITDYSKYNQWWRKARYFNISKTENKAFRQATKNATFGAIYDMKPPKAQETLNGATAELWKIDKNLPPVNVTEEEAKVALAAHRRAIPLTYKMVEANVELALRQGYLQLNDRSCSRIHFDTVKLMLRAVNDVIEEEKEKGNQCYLASVRYGVYIIKSINTDFEEEFRLSGTEYNEVSGAARNMPISGTQADMVKEMMVEMDRLIPDLPGNWKFHLQVHDELVYSVDAEVEYMIIENEKWKYKGTVYGILKHVMQTVANRYLKNVTMKAELTIKDFWYK